MNTANKFIQHFPHGTAAAKHHTQVKFLCHWAAVREVQLLRRLRLAPEYTSPLGLQLVTTHHTVFITT